MSIENLSFSLGFLINILKNITIKIVLTTSNIITIILNTDTPATRPVDPVCESLDEEMSDGVKLVNDGVELIVNDGVELVVVELSIVIIIVTGGDLSLSYSALLVVKTPYTWNTYSISCCNLGDPIETTNTGNIIV